MTEQEYSRPTTGEGWSFYSKRTIEEMIEEGELEEPEEYGFEDLREMKNFIKGYGDYRDHETDFKPSYKDKDQQNKVQPQEVTWEETREALEDE